jgi:CheY-like chemotaxis protein
VYHEINEEFDNIHRDLSSSFLDEFLHIALTDDSLGLDGEESQQEENCSDSMEQLVLIHADTSPADPELPRLDTILVVDDAPLNRRMLVMMLDRRYLASEILEAEDGIQAVSLYQSCLSQSKAVHLILMDYHMPNMNGPTAAKRIREMGYEGVIFGVTGNALPEDIQTFRSHGADQVLMKPVKVKVLEAAIKEYCRL